MSDSGDEAAARREALAPYRLDEALLDARGAAARSRCTACRRTPARRSPRACSTATASGSGTRRRTAGTCSRRCSNLPRRRGKVSGHAHQQVVRALLAFARRPPRARRRRTSPARDPEATREQLQRFLDPREVVVVTPRAAAGGARRGRRPRAHDPRRRGRPAGRPAGASAASRPTTCARTSRGCSAEPARHSRASPARPTACCARSTARAASPGVGPSFPILGYDDLTAAQVNERLGDLDSAAAAQGARLREAQREPQVGARGGRAEAQVAPAPCHPRRHVLRGPIAPPAPRRGDELELTVDSLAYGGNGVARRDGYVVFVAGGLPGDRVRAVVGKAKRAYAEARAVEILEPSPDRLPEVADHPGAPWQVLPYERQLEVKAEQVAEALTRIGHLEGYELEPIVPRRAAVALPQQARVLVRHGRERRAGVRLPRARALRPDPRRWTTASSPPSAATSCARRCSLSAAAQGLSAWDRREQRRASCATSSSARAGARASSRSAWSPRPAGSTSTP